VKLGLTLKEPEVPNSAKETGHERIFFGNFGREKIMGDLWQSMVKLCFGVMFFGA